MRTHGLFPFYLSCFERKRCVEVAPRLFSMAARFAGACCAGSSGLLDPERAPAITGLGLGVLGFWGL